MARIADFGSTAASLGNALGQGVSQDINQKLDIFTQNKINQMMAQQKSAQVRPFWDKILGSELGGMVSNQPESIQKLLFDRIEGLNIGLPGQGQPDQQGAINTPSAGLSNLQNLLPNQQTQTPNATATSPAGLRIGASSQERKERRKEANEQRRHDEAMDFRRKEAELNRDEKKLHRFDVYNKDFIQSIPKVKKEANQGIRDNEILMQLAKSGNLRNPKLQAGLERIGLGDYWLNPSTTLFQNIVSQQATKAGEAFNTSRLTNLDVSLYKKTLARLTDTPEAIEVIAKNKILEHRAELLRADASQKLLKEQKYKDLEPEEFQSAVEDKIEPELKKLSKKAQDNVLNVLGKQTQGRQRQSQPGDQRINKKTMVTEQLDVNGNWVPVEGGR